MENLNGKICVVTGANSGLGKATALKLAKMGATTVLVCRSLERGEAAFEEIAALTGSRSVHLMLCDLSSQKSIREFTKKFKEKFNALHILINNAGVSILRREVTPDGIEATLATNHLGPFLLTNLLLDVIKRSAPARIINVSSVSHRRTTIDFDDLQGEKKYDGNRAYGQSKLANILFTYELAKRLKGTGVTVNALCPGGVSTGIWRHFNPLLRGFLKAILKTPEEAAKLPLYLATSKELEGATGKYFEYKRHLRISSRIGFFKFDVTKAETKSSPESYDEKAAKQLWDISEKMVGLA